MSLDSKEILLYTSIIGDALAAVQGFNKFSDPLTRIISQSIVSVLSDTQNTKTVRGAIDRSIGFPMSLQTPLREIGLSVYEYNGTRSITGSQGTIQDRKVALQIYNSKIFLDFIQEALENQESKGVAMDLLQYFSEGLKRNEFHVKFDFYDKKLESIAPESESLKNLLKIASPLLKILYPSPDSPYGDLTELLTKHIETNTLKEFILISRYSEDPDLSRLYIGPGRIESMWIESAWNRLITIINQITLDGILERDKQLCVIFYFKISSLLDKLEAALMQSPIWDVKNGKEGIQLTLGEFFGLSLYDRIPVWRNDIKKLQVKQ